MYVGHMAANLAYDKSGPASGRVAQHLAHDVFKIVQKTTVRGRATNFCLL